MGAGFRRLIIGLLLARLIGLSVSPGYVFAQSPNLPESDAARPADAIIIRPNALIEDLVAGRQLPPLVLSLDGTSTEFTLATQTMRPTKAVLMTERGPIEDQFESRLIVGTAADATLQLTFSSDKSGESGILEGIVVRGHDFYHLRTEKFLRNSSYSAVEQVKLEVKKFSYDDYERLVAQLGGTGCGGNHAEFDDLLLATNEGRGSSPAVPTLRVLQLATESDYEHTVAWGGYPGGANAAIQAAVNILDTIYRAQLQTTVYLTFERAWTTANDPYVDLDPRGNVSAMMESFSASVRSANDYDQLMLWTGRNFRDPQSGGDIIGVNYGAACGARAGSMIEGYLGRNNLTTAALMAAHELGHSIAMQHDTNNCNYIMCPYFNGSTSFSPESVNSAEGVLASGYCLAIQEISSWNEIPTVPTNLAASENVYADRIRVTWSLPVGGGYADSYDVYRSLTNERCVGDPIAAHVPQSLQSGEVQFIDPVELSSNDYYYSVKSHGPGGYSDCSATVHGRAFSLPPAPTLNARSFSDHVGLPYTFVSTLYGIDRVELERASTSDGPFVLVSVDNARDRFSGEFSDRLGDLQPYYYRARGVTRSGAGPWSEVVRTGLRQSAAQILVTPGRAGLVFDAGVLGQVVTDAEGRGGIPNSPPQAVGTTIHLRPVSGDAVITPLSYNVTVADSEQVANFTLTAAPLNGRVVSGNDPIVGATVDAGALGRQTTDSNGSFNFPRLPLSTTYSVRATHPQYRITPESIAGTVGTTRTPLTFSGARYLPVRGHIATAAGAPLAGVRVSSAGLSSVLTDGQGNYELIGGYSGQYLVVNFTPPTGYYLSPTGAALYVASDSVVNSTVTHAPVTGRILRGGNPLGGVSITARDAAGTVRSASSLADGTYQIGNLSVGTEFTITPSAVGSIFTPLSLDRVINLTNVADFDSIAAFDVDLTITTAGNRNNIPIDGGPLGVRMTDVNGRARFPQLAEGSQYLFRAGAGFTMNPVEVRGTVSQSTSLSAEIVASPVTVRVRLADNSPVAGIAIDGGVLGNGITNQTGSVVYSNINHGVHYVVRPSDARYTFRPTSIAGNVNLQTTLIFIATPVSSSSSSSSSINQSSSSDSSSSQVSSSSSSFESSSEQSSVTQSSAGSSSAGSSSAGADCGDEDCAFAPLPPLACVGANGFFHQVNIATVQNLLPTPLAVQVEYRNLEGVSKGMIRFQLEGGLKRDLIINDMGLEYDSYGTVCVTTNASTSGAWTGGISIYKSDTRHDSKPNFGAGFDYVLNYPFATAKRGTTTMPLNTFRLGMPANALVANWISISDLAMDGRELRGELQVFAEDGTLRYSTRVQIADGGRVDYSGHDALMGDRTRDLVGLVKFSQSDVDGVLADYSLTVTRLFYDCAGGSCSDFVTGFVVPDRQETVDSLHGGVLKNRGEMVVVELNNTEVVPVPSRATFRNSGGATVQSLDVEIPPLGTRHLIVPTSTEPSFEPASVSVESFDAPLQARVFHYRLEDIAGGGNQLLWASARALTTAGRARQTTQFNTFINNLNSLELTNTDPSSLDLHLSAIDQSGQVVFNQSLSLPAWGTTRLALPLSPDNYGTLVLDGSRSGYVARSEIRRNHEYSLPFVAR